MGSKTRTKSDQLIKSSKEKKIDGVLISSTDGRHTFKYEDAMSNTLNKIKASTIINTSDSGKEVQRKIMCLKG